MIKEIRHIQNLAKKAFSFANPDQASHNLDTNHPFWRLPLYTDIEIEVAKIVISKVFYHNRHFQKKGLAH
mgnify:CR=1 FL=1